MRWWEKLSRLLDSDASGVASCSECMFWTPVKGTSVSCRCRNLTSKHYDENTSGDFCCEEFRRFGTSDDDTPVEIPERLHRKRTEGDGGEES